MLRIVAQMLIFGIFFGVASGAMLRYMIHRVYNDIIIEIALTGAPSLRALRVRLYPLLCFSIALPPSPPSTLFMSSCLTLSSMMPCLSGLIRTYHNGMV